MKLPTSPPPLNSLSKEELYAAMVSPVRIHDDAYLPWEEFRRRPVPDGLTVRAAWWSIQKHRLQVSRKLPLVLGDRQFTLAETPPVHELLHTIDRDAAGRIEIPSVVATEATREHYLITSLMEEAIASAQLEGAATTRRVAKEMLRAERRPKDNSEQMIVNNYAAIRLLRELERPLTLSQILTLHDTLTRGTDVEPRYCGTLRTTDDVVVRSADDTVLHQPPPASTLPARLHTLLQFANKETPERFLHPVLRAILLHFWLGFEHPFVDGNGRTARALFYWSLLQDGYWLAEYFSISAGLRKAHGRYTRSFLYTEESFDTTYFVLHQLRILREAVDTLYANLERREEEVAFIRRTLGDHLDFNHRQVAVLKRALKDPHTEFSFKSHRNSHRVVNQTARTDLLKLEQAGLLVRGKRGRQIIFRPVQQLEQRLKDL